MNFIYQIIEFQLFGHIFCCFSQCLRPSIGIAEKYGMNTSTLIFLDPVKLSGSTTNSQESQNLKARNPQNKSFQILDPVPWNGPCNLTQNQIQHGLKKCWSMIRTRFLKRLVRF